MGTRRITGTSPHLFLCCALSLSSIELFEQLLFRHAARLGRVHPAMPYDFHSAHDVGLGESALFRTFDAFGKALSRPLVVGIHAALSAPAPWCGACSTRTRLPTKNRVEVLTGAARVFVDGLGHLREFIPR